MDFGLPHLGMIAINVLFNSLTIELDSFVVAEEIIHHWKKKKRGGVGGLLVKLDFEKAYDSLDHAFLDNMLNDMGFGWKWRQWIESCISSYVLAVLVNVKLTKEFRMEGGLNVKLT
ncbi:hypothetical protein Dsin_014839 [Dipteronia sinensis]|uniref:Reverse transcriptase domain-containing protein n=1 Tax=Dipteronia sinensis TaxID=43782 RepID=A0AAE0EAE8_9ROSI|nr:hypothetical protein Dsin_014839 [Dipteronia sinensis]